MKLSVVISHLNDEAELNQTIASIRASTDREIEIVVIDDLSSTRLTPSDKSVKLIHNRYRCGVGPARHIGVMHATGDLILITDSHVRFQPGWLEPVLAFMSDKPKTILCGQCLGLSDENMNMDRPDCVYNGARMVISEPRNKEIRYRILSARWATDRPGMDLYPLSAIMGACYVMWREYFLNIGGTALLREFGHDEEYLSLKTLLAGGDLVMFKGLKIGHKFRRAKQKPPYTVYLQSLYYNIMVMAHTCCEKAEAEELIAQMGVSGDLTKAKEIFKRNFGIVGVERERLKRVFTRSWQEVVSIIDRINA